MKFQCSLQIFFDRPRVQNIQQFFCSRDRPARLFDASSQAELLTAVPVTSSAGRLMDRFRVIARSADTVWLSKNASRARSFIWRRRRVVTRAATRPRWTSGNPMRKSSPAMPKSHASTSPAPPPTAAPACRATVIRGEVFNARYILAAASAERCEFAGSLASVKSNPAQKLGPSARSTMARRFGSFAASRNASH